MANRLADATSPYLLQHADNPVDWWEWCAEAFAEARRRDVPVLLSVGYAACHWCHVMAHESFEDAEVAARAERALRGDQGRPRGAAGHRRGLHGGDHRDDRARRLADDLPADPGRRAVLLRHLLPASRASCGCWRRSTEAWTERRDEVRRGRRRGSCEALQAALATGDTGGRRSGRAELDAGGGPAAAQQYDRPHGGFGSAPKFPPSMVLEFLLRHHARTGDPARWRWSSATCEAMARGGIYDQLAGGFARYSVDAGWVVPHFEKMLYDNAQLLRVYAHLWRADPARRWPSGSPRETAEFLLRDLRTGRAGSPPRWTPTPTASRA